MPPSIALANPPMVSRHHSTSAAMYPRPHPLHPHHIPMPATSMTGSTASASASAPPAPRLLPPMAKLPASTPATTANGVPISHHSEKVKRYLSEFDSLLLSHSMNKALAMFGGDADTEAEAQDEDDADYLTSCPPSPKPEPNEVDDPMDVVPASRPMVHHAFDHKLPTPEPSSPNLAATPAPAVPISSTPTPVPAAQVAYRPRIAIGRARAFSAPVPWATPLASPAASAAPVPSLTPQAPPSPMSAPVGPHTDAAAPSPRKRRRSVGDADDPEMMSARPTVRRRCALPDIRIPLALLLAEARTAHGPEAHM